MARDHFLKAVAGFSIKIFPEPLLMRGKGVHCDRKICVGAETAVTRAEIAKVKFADIIFPKKDRKKEGDKIK